MIELLRAQVAGLQRAYDARRDTTRALSELVWTPYNAEMYLRSARIEAELGRQLADARGQLIRAKLAA
jgi:hypothetical protein